ncbi:MAG TPA: hypothetical protein VIO58_08385 [Candidatus Methanoperedens sp.]
MQGQKALNRMKRLEKEMHELKCSIYSQMKASSITGKRKMHNAALGFLKLKDIPDKIELSSVELVRKERKHGRGY